MSEAAQPALSVALLPLGNFTLLPFAGFVDVLRLAADEGDRSRPLACRWSILAPELAPIRSSSGVAVTPWQRLAEANPAQFDYVVVVGGLLPASGTLQLDQARAAFLRTAARAGCTVIGICTGSFALAEAGLLPEGRRCCVSWYHHRDLQERFPGLEPVADQLWVQQGRIITCAGGTAAADLAASLVGRHLGPAAAQKSLHILVEDAARPAIAPQPCPVQNLAVADMRVRRALRLMQQHLATPMAAEELADHLAISRRQLERRFRLAVGSGVQEFSRSLRLAHAVWLLGSSTTGITEIAGQCGFSDGPHFNRRFREAFGLAPSAARRQGRAALERMLAAWWPHAVALPIALTDPVTQIGPAIQAPLVPDATAGTDGPQPLPPSAATPAQHLGRPPSRPLRTALHA